MTGAVLPGTRASLLWLVRHELRLWSRDGSLRLRTRAIVAVLVLVLPTLIGGAVAWQLRNVTDVPHASFGVVVAANAALVLLMLSGASVYVLRSFHDRGDLDLLLAAPVPPRRVLAAKAVAVHASVGLPLLTIFSPFLIISALLGHPGWLGGIVMIAVTAVVATSLAFVLATGLFKVMGARRARVVIQIGGGVFAATVAVGAQIPNFAPQLFRGIGAWLSAPPPPPFDLPARAAFGDPLALALMVGLAGAMALAAAQVASGRMGRHGEAVDAGRIVTRSAAFRGRSRKSLIGVMFAKELRLLGRDPELLASVALQLAYMVPAFSLIFAGGGVSPGRLAAACVLFAALLPSSLAWLTLCGEDAPDLIATAPVPNSLVVRAKLFAACLPALLLVALPIVYVIAIDVRAGLIALLLAPVAAVAAGLQQHWVGRPQPRRTFRYRQRGSLLLAISEYVMAGCWAGAANLLSRGSVWAAPLLVLALLILLGSRLLRARRERRSA
jgi:ABC-2 type transport system permease protein